MTRIVVHPVLFAAAPILVFFQRNLDEVRPGAAVAPVLLSMAAAGLVWALLHGLLRDARRSALFASVLVGSFFAYGEWINNGLCRTALGCAATLAVLTVLLTGLFRGWRTAAVVAGLAAAAGAALIWAGGADLVSDLLLESATNTAASFAAWLAALGVLLKLAAGVEKRRDLVTDWLNLWSVIAVLVPSIVVAAALSDGGFEPRSAETAAPGRPAPLPEDLPDIFYVVPDGYGRADVLAGEYGYDVGDFVAFLESRGFYVAAKSRSNYAMSFLSLTSTLNFDYLENLEGVAELIPSSVLQRPVVRHLHDNRVVSLLRAHGYQVLSFTTGFEGTDGMKVDLRLGPSLGAFPRLVIQKTPLETVLELWPEASLFDVHRKRVRYTLETLKSLPESPERPLFVFAHVLVPHNPFVFGADGEAIDSDGPFTFVYDNSLSREEYHRAYGDQVVFLNKLLRESIDGILARSRRPLVILLQGDHGPAAVPGDRSTPEAMAERMPILNAYYFSDTDYGELYPGITPVNSFRVVFRKYLGLDLADLPDRSSHSVWAAPYLFTEAGD